MKTKTMKIKLNAQSRIGYYYMGLLSRKRRIKEYGKLLDGVNWRLPRLFENIRAMGITCDELINSKDWKASIDDYARKEITG
tara:strand:- start:2022 stop:2267 length:246 start_codon:yes stop_codon:yes gene_type:complete